MVVVIPMLAASTEIGYLKYQANMLLFISCDSMIIVLVLILCRAQLLTSWLECIPYLKETIKKYYFPGAFLMDATSSAEKLYKDAVLIIDPLQHLPFKFYPQQPAAMAEPAALPPVMKTHAATGQRSGPITGESAGMSAVLTACNIASIM